MKIYFLLMLLMKTFAKFVKSIFMLILIFNAESQGVCIVHLISSSVKCLVKCFVPFLSVVLHNQFHLHALKKVSVDSFHSLLEFRHRQ